ncbi:hypothetical protein [Mycolicibacter kumamotonensis]|uniref:hypothetical protein n=1 Tax=Mycolicibacter kumamotonensis TaxID=354243 RepID=UPI00105672C3|nr:hypothetical protein [Mycolicibacter kumamotonensis]
MSLATEADVAAALGVEDISELTDSQVTRLPGELARVERAFLREAERDFTPGPVRVQCTVVGGWVTLMDSPVDGTDIEIEDRDGKELTAMVSDGPRLKVGRNDWPLPSGVIVNVSYTAPPVPEAVKAAIGSIVARRLSVQPGSPETKFTDLTAGSDFRAKGAAWVTSTSVLTDDEKAEARSYRPVAGTVIISRWDDRRNRWLDGWRWDWANWWSARF